jgi:hypothetical protein
MPTKLIPASDEEIRALAHKYWEDEGRPEGQAEIHWQRAYVALAKPAKAAPKPTAKEPAAKRPAAKKAAPTKTSKPKSP